MLGAAAVIYANGELFLARALCLKPDANLLLACKHSCGIACSVETSSKPA